MSKKQQASSSSFVLFPNTYPLIRPFNIPEPIIHPPGINPCSSLNPKSHADDKLKPMAPLDVDPCAVSRSEVTTKTTFLTASEHAGGSLPEPRMEPKASDSPVNTDSSDPQIANDPSMAIMVSDSPADSETSAPQIVNDVGETKTESKNAQVIRCDVCNVICNSEVMFNGHKLGKKHLKKMQNLSVSSPIIKETPSEVANVVLDQESDQKKKKEDFLKNEASVKKLFVCNIPELNTFTEHFHGEKLETQDIGDVVRLALKNRGIPGLPDSPTGNQNEATSEPLVQSSISGSEKVEDELKVSMLLWCEVCKVTCSSHKNILEHNLGKKHLKNLEISERLRTPPLTTPTASKATTTMEKTGDSEAVKRRWCDLCKIYRSSYCFNRHVLGYRHRKNLEESKKMEEGLPSTHFDQTIIQANDRVENAPVAERMMQDRMNEEGKADIVETGKRKADGTQEEEDGKRKKMVTEGGGSGASIMCRVCNVACNSVMDFVDHRAGQKHSAMVLERDKALIK